MKYLIAVFLFLVGSPALANDEQLKCLADNAYYEAGNQGLKGMIAVSNVVINRTNDKRFPDTPCKVIRQRYNNKCQFSWVCASRIPPKNKKNYEVSKMAAKMVLNKETGDITSGSLFFHNRFAKPFKNAIRKVIIGDHLFYR